MVKRNNYVLDRIKKELSEAEKLAGDQSDPEIVELAREKGAFTVGISNYPRSPLREASEIFFCTSFPENRVKVAAISSKVAQMCILDALYLLVARHAEGLWDVERINSLTEKMIRMKSRK